MKKILLSLCLCLSVPCLAVTNNCGVDDPYLCQLAELGDLKSLFALGVMYENGQRQKMELYYIEHSCWNMDIRILWQTIKVVLSGDGAC